MRKLFGFIALLSLFILTGCLETGETIVLPNLNGMSRAEIASELEDLGITYFFQFADVAIKNDSELDKFVSYSGYRAGRKFPINKTLYINTTVLPLTVNRLDEVAIDFEYKNKSFINDGVGIVTLVSPTDGDTARFKDVITNEVVRVRFLGIDTPESTSQIDPWGKKASLFTKGRLENATTIVLESEGARTDTYGRHLAFVWIDGVLLNLEIIQEAYSNSTLAISKSKYGLIFTEVSMMVSKTGRRFFGEVDPDYDYTNKK